jgi:hypothetical protein
MKPILIAVAGLILIQISGCSTYAGDRYSISVNNVVALRLYRGNEVGVGEFTSSHPSFSTLSCWGVMRVKTPDGETFQNYIRNALISELKIAEAYADNGQNTLTGHLDKMYFSESTGQWKILLTLTSTNGESITTEENYAFTTSFYTDATCDQTAQALMPAVQNLIEKLVRHPRFGQLVMR